MKNLSQKPRIEQEVWGKIAPTWPLKNIIACNPLQGFENLQFEEALKQGHKFFQNEEIPFELEKINKITIKWCQVFFDVGQATIKMPNRHKGFYKSWKELAIFDNELHQNLKENIDFIKNLPDLSNDAINKILEEFQLSKEDQNKFLTMILTTLSGWSSYVKYLGEWSYQKNSEIEDDYLAIRLAITAIIWPKAGEKIVKFLKTSFEKTTEKTLKRIISNENQYSTKFLQEIAKNKQYLKSEKGKYDAQLVFCIDVRSEPIRKALESCGNYETFGFAGFFGIPTTITNHLSEESYASCPVLLSPKHNVIQKPICSHAAYEKQIKGYSTISEIKKFYQSLKYNFTTPLPLAEGMGIWSGGWMFIKTFSPKGRKFLQKKLNKTLNQNLKSSPEIDSIPFSDQCNYAIGALRAIGLIENFSEIIVLCGHGSQTENNTYATSLDCGACGGRHGDSNAKILAKILNQKQVRHFLEKEGIFIPQNTKFIAAKHNTTTDEIEIYEEEVFYSKNLDNLKNAFSKAKEINNIYRASKMGFNDSENKISEFFFKRSHNWSETQGEWGLAKNASFIVAPRDLTKNINLDGRSFLHSYDWQIDEDGGILNLILNAPMIVAQWINSQYLFSTIDNVAYGAGSKITQNVVGKIGVMQGNASDLMHGLPLQSVYVNDEKPYHKAVRLLSLIYAPSNKIDQIISKSPKLQQLIVNKWIKIFCLDPRNNKIYQLQNDLLWNELS